MSDNPLIYTPAAEPALKGETLPVPTPEQEKVADQLFGQPEQRHVAVDLVGLVGAAHLLHDLATETFHGSEPEEDLDRRENQPDGDDEE